MLRTPLAALTLVGFTILSSSLVHAQIGTRFPSERKVVPDPVTGVPLTFLTSKPVGDSKIYPTHLQWTADGRWVLFRSNRVPGELMAVNEESGVIVQVTEKGFMGMACSSFKANRLYIMRDLSAPPPPREVIPETPPAVAAQSPSDTARAAATDGAATSGANGTATSSAAPRAPRPRPKGPFQIIAIDLDRVFADSEAGTMKPASSYERVCGTVPEGIFADGNMGLDANEDYMYFRVSGDAVAALLPADQKPAEKFGPRGMGAGPNGLASMNLKTGEYKHIVTVPFQIGHVQTNPWVPGEIVFCWETGGKSPTRMWTVMADGTGLRPVYPEAEYEWITHEAVITKDEVAFAIIALRRPRVPGAPEPTNVPQAGNGWGPAGSGDHPTGLAITNLRTREVRIVGQVPRGDPGRSFWHVHGSPDGRWAVADDFQYRTWIIDRHTGELALLTDNGHKTTARDHQHPTFSPDSKKIEIQSAMLSENGSSLNICIVPVPESWLARKYDSKLLK